MLTRVAGALAWADRSASGYGGETKLVTAFEALKQLHARGVTILLVEQNVNTTLHLVDRAYVLEQGQIVLEGTGAELLGNSHVQEAYLGI